jgi:hypothetical protein
MDLAWLMLLLLSIQIMYIQFCLNIAEIEF